MPTSVIMPALGMAQDTGKVVRWLRSEGDEVVKGEPLLEIETDKVTVEVEAPADGRLAAVTALAGDEVPVGEPVAVVLAVGESAAPAPGADPPGVTLPPPRPATTPTPVAAVPTVGGRRRLASPKARRIAAEQGIDIGSLAGTGPSGAIIAGDVLSAANGEGGPRADQLRAPSTVWKLMAERVTESWQTVPHFVLCREIDATRLESWRAAARTRPRCESLTHTDLLVKLAAEALRRHPRVNSSWQEGMIATAGAVNIGIAVAGEGGLVVPVIHGAAGLSLAAVAARRSELVAAAREGRLRPADVGGGTFTISNLGMYGIDSFDAIVNAPEAAILAVGRIADRIVPVDGLPAVRPTVRLAVSFDHRVVDGARGAEFLETLASLVEEPAGLVE
jgi:pyruvate dehydrogenase E2 component (dihydrolipoamide acetyltransferase)